MTQQYAPMHTGVKEIQQLTPMGPTTDTASGPKLLINRTKWNLMVFLVSDF